ncbi:MAG: DEAD/DEAH box helicase [Candidatus Diapherotrites archaeon]|nr:DEAD/DEAH box helicase [Candidatus Diapherotrites archaeon]
MSFENIDFSIELKNAIKKMGYDDATKVQSGTIPLIISGHNVIVKSHTGSGKTAAFGIPISDNILKGKSKSALVLCPTRELAMQVKDEIRKINSHTRLNVAAFYGGHGMGFEFKSIRQGISILCSTPGRLLDHFRSNNLDPRKFDTVVLDEADRMLDMGFIQDLKTILDFVKPKNVHLFSATLDGKVARLINEYIPTYEEIILPEEIVGKNIIEKHIKVPQEMKLTALQDVIKEAQDKRVLVFVATKSGADFLTKKLYGLGYGVESIHGGKSQRAREMALDNFKIGKRKILIATDVAARGLQVDDIGFVVNYDLANDADTHKHRIGRTGRMGDTGNAISFVGEDGKVIVPAHFRGGGGRGRGQRGGRGNFGYGNSRGRSSSGGSSYGGRRYGSDSRGSGSHHSSGSSRGRGDGHSGGSHSSGSSSGHSGRKSFGRKFKRD